MPAIMPQSMVAELISVEYKDPAVFNVKTAGFDFLQLCQKVCQ